MKVTRRPDAHRLPFILRDGRPAGAHREQAPASALASLPGGSALRDRLAARARATIEEQYSTEVACGRPSAFHHQQAGTQ
ncbi:hypothetical protein HAV22_14930 [Massilia sp. TW-1]|uniref:Uncharacterized protein n=1 Tax=Telluria antibiotica TaxID=2717319 RepID=A0ABX0PE97_9BURK|nr:hypothetical protein [Telluria antibiotica]NIA54929.1 hypothetical protein [Telluria antibiotica]